MLVLMPTCPVFNYPSHPLSLGCSEMPTNEPGENFKGLDAPLGKLSEKNQAPLWVVKLVLKLLENNLSRGIFVF